MPLTKKGQRLIKRAIKENNRLIKRLFKENKMPWRKKKNKRELEWYEIPTEKLTKSEQKIVEALIKIHNSYTKQGNDFYEKQDLMKIQSVKKD